MKKLILLTLLTLLTQYTQSQWMQQVSGVTTHLLDVDFINENTGWACGDGGIIVKTTNGGVNWVQQTSGVNKRLEGIDAVDANILHCVGWWQTILKSTNGGTNWIVIRNGPSGTGASFNKTYFLNVNTGWLLRDGGSGGYILRTTNGGATFDSTNVIFSFMWDIYFKDALNGILCGDGALVMRSTDGGVTWNQIFLPLLTGAPNLYRLSFVGDYGWTIGEGAENNMGKMVFRTTNFGSSWDSIARVPYPDLQLNYSVFFSSLNTGYCGGTTGYIFKSTNGGFNWYQQNSPSNGFRRDFWLANDSLGWSVGGGGQIFKTTNGGTYVGIEPISNVNPIEFNLYQNYPNPFNPITTIKYDLPKDVKVTIKVYDLLGREIETIINNEFKTAGWYEINWNANKYASGVYIYRIEAGDFVQSKKMVLIK